MSSPQACCWRAGAESEARTAGIGFGGKRSCGGGMRKGTGSVYLERGVNVCARAWGQKLCVCRGMCPLRAGVDGGGRVGCMKGRTPAIRVCACARVCTLGVHPKYCLDKGTQCITALRSMCVQTHTRVACVP